MSGHEPGPESEPGPGPGPEFGPEPGPGRVRPTVPAGRARRPRSARTAVTAVVVTAALVAAGMVLYDAVAIRTGHAARRWHTELTRELSTRHLDDPWVLGAAGAAAVLGVVLCVLAFAPGLRRWLPLRRPGAAVHRSGVATLIAARATDLAGVERCTVKVRRRRARATVTGVAEPAWVQRELREEMERVTLAGAYRLDVRTRLSPTGRPHDRGHRRLAQEPPR